MDKKLIIFFFLSTVAIIGGGVLLSGSSESKPVIQKTKEAKLAAEHKQKNVGNIDYNKGVYLHIFPIQNKGTKDLQITDIATSCACTKAYLKKADVVGPMFTMKGMSAPSSWIGTLKPGEKAEVIAAFDAQYHGPSGVGAISRTVSFETNDIDKPYVELSFDGVVVK